MTGMISLLPCLFSYNAGSDVGTDVLHDEDDEDEDDDEDDDEDEEGENDKDGSGEGDVSTGAVGAVNPSFSASGTDGASKALVGVDVGADVLDDEDENAALGTMGDGTLTTDDAVGPSLALRAAIFSRISAFSTTKDSISNVLL